jgi:hypothetical protein
MHDPTAEGNAYFKCDFCRAEWTETLPMVEGHQGSLICIKCLTLAYAEVVNVGEGVRHEDVHNCTMCLSHREEPHWRSPVYDDAVICRWCIERAALMMSKDPDTAWTPPTPA